MPAENEERREAFPRMEAAEEYSFDQLAKGLAGGHLSRGQALKLVGAALLGVGSLSLVGGVARAKSKHKHRHGKAPTASAFDSAKATPSAKGGNSDAAHFCQNLPPGQRGQCVSDAAQGTGLFFECGGDVTRLCGTVCCGANETCDNGQCRVQGCGPVGSPCDATPIDCASGGHCLELADRSRTVCIGGIESCVNDCSQCSPAATCVARPSNPPPEIDLCRGYPGYPLMCMRACQH